MASQLRAATAFEGNGPDAAAAGAADKRAIEAAFAFQFSAKGTLNPTTAGQPMIRKRNKLATRGGDPRREI